MHRFLALADTESVERATELRVSRKPKALPCMQGPRTADFIWQNSRRKNIGDYSFCDYDLALLGRKSPTIYKINRLTNNISIARLALVLCTGGLGTLWLVMRTLSMRVAIGPWIVILPVAALLYCLNVVAAWNADAVPDPTS